MLAQPVRVGLDRGEFLPFDWLIDQPRLDVLTKEDRLRLVLFREVPPFPDLGLQSAIQCLRLALVSGSIAFVPAIHCKADPPDPRSLRFLDDAPIPSACSCHDVILPSYCAVAVRASVSAAGPDTRAGPAGSRTGSPSFGPSAGTSAAARRSASNSRHIPSPRTAC